MKRGTEGFDLLHQPLDQFLRAHFREGGDVVDGLVRVELGQLAANLFQRVHHVGLDVEQAEFENLEQAARARADDQRVGLNR